MVNTNETVQFLTGIFGFALNISPEMNVCYSVIEFYCFVRSDGNLLSVDYV